MLNRLKYFTIVCGALVLFLALIESNAFKKREKIYWESEQPINWSHFRGYPNYLCEYAGAINSYFTYDVFNNQTDSIAVLTFMKPHHSWVKDRYTYSDYLLRHEQYHFNISELVARRFRQKLIELQDNNLEKEAIQKLYLQYLSELGNTQDYYDYETDHSLNVERQLDWEYIVDSMLNELGMFASPIICKSQPIETNSRFYRKISRNGWHGFDGQYPIDSITAMKTWHYRFSYDGNEVRKIEFWNRNMRAMDEQYEFSTIEFSRLGNTVFQKYFDIHHHPIKNQMGVYAQSIESDKNTLIVTNLDEHGNKIENKTKFCKIIWKLDHKKRKSVGWFYDLEGNRITDSEGYYTIKYEYDNNNNQIEYANYDSNNKLKNNVNGIAFLRYTYDIKNNLTGIWAYNANSKLTPLENNTAILEYRYDQNGYATLHCSKDVDGNIVLDERGYGINNYGYDYYGNTIFEVHYGLNRNIIISDEGLGLLKRSFDSIGRVVEVQNYDAYKQLLNDKYGKCQLKYTYSNDNLITDEQHYFVDTLFQVQHLKTIKYAYDSSQNIIGETWYNANLEIQKDTNGICTVKYEYDKFNNLTKVAYYNDSNKVRLDAQKIGTYVYEYDDNRNRTRISYFNELGQPTNNPKNCASEVYKYNPQNLVVESRYFDVNGHPTADENGIEVIRLKYNPKGQLSEESYFNSDGSKSADMHGVSTYSYTRDTVGNLVQISCYGKNGKLVINENAGVAIIQNSYNSKSELTFTSNYNHLNKLTTNNLGVASERYHYNNYGKLVRKECLSEYGDLVVSADGYAGIDFLYDLNLNLVAQLYVDESNALIEDQNGYAIYNYVYDRNGYVTNRINYDATPINRSKIDLGYYSTKLLEQNLSNYRNPEHNGTRVQTTHYKNGQKRSEVTYINGNLEGKYTSWYETGELEGIITYVNGKRHGFTIEYAKNGQKISEITYENNACIVGSEKRWYENGQLRSEYINGEYVEYNQQGNRVLN